MGRSKKSSSAKSKANKKTSGQNSASLLPDNAHAPRRTAGKKLTDAERRQIIDLYKTNDLTVIKIAEMMNVSRPTVYKILRDADIEAIREDTPTVGPDTLSQLFAGNFPLYEQITREVFRKIAGGELSERDLVTAWATITDKYLKVQEQAVRWQEMAFKREEAASQRTTGLPLLLDFKKVIKEAQTLKKREEARTINGDEETIVDVEVEEIKGE